MSSEDTKDDSIISKKEDAMKQLGIEKKYVDQEDGRVTRNVNIQLLLLDDFDFC